MRFLVGIIGAILVFVAVNFLPAVQNYYDAKASAYLEQGDLKKARRFYFPGKIRGSEKAINNYHVLNYRITRSDDEYSKKKYLKIRRKAFRAFDKLTQRGYVPAAYNAGMFYYRSRVDSGEYYTGLKYFDFAAAQGDEMSRDAAGLMRARVRDKDKRSRAYRKAADGGNTLAAYYYAKGLRFDKKKLKRAEKYALLGAEGGYADAQQFLGAYFPKRKDAKSWLEKAATNPDYPSLLAASDLAKLADNKRDYVAKRRWLTLGSTPREKFKYNILIEPDGLRWRGIRNTILADVNNSKSAAYELALMQLDGLGGALDFDAAKANLKYADNWADAERLLARINSGKFDTSKPRRSQKSKDQSKFDLARFDKQKNYPFYDKLRPLMVSKTIRYATQKDLDKFSQGVSTTFSNEKSGFKKRGGIEKCALGRNCFYMEKPIILPKGMNGAHSATFLINPGFFMAEQFKSHNRYIFLNERYIP